MSAAHDLLARPAPAPARAAIGPETVVELVPPRWRWRVITPGQWRVLSRLGRRTRVRDLVPPAGAGVAEVVELVTELVAAGFLVPEERADPAEADEPPAEPSARPRAEPAGEPAVTAADAPAGSAAPLDADRTGGQPRHDRLPGLPADPAAAQPDPPSPRTNHHGQPVVVETWVEPDVDRVAEPFAEPSPGPQPRSAW